MNVARKYAIHLFFPLIVLIVPSVTMGWDKQVTTKIGDIMVDTDDPGATFITGENGAYFPDCPGVAYADPAYYTPDGAKSALAVLLFARGINADVTVYYRVDGSGNCRFEQVQLRP